MEVPQRALRGDITVVVVAVIDIELDVAAVVECCLGNTIERRHSDGSPCDRPHQQQLRIHRLGLPTSSPVAPLNLVDNHAPTLSRAYRS